MLGHNEKIVFLTRTFYEAMFVTVITTQNSRIETVVEVKVLTLVFVHKSFVIFVEIGVFFWTRRTVTRPVIASGKSAPVVASTNTYTIQKQNTSTEKKH